MQIPRFFMAMPNLHQQVCVAIIPTLNDDICLADAMATHWLGLTGLLLDLWMVSLSLNNQPKYSHAAERRRRPIFDNAIQVHLDPKSVLVHSRTFMIGPFVTFELFYR